MDIAILTAHLQELKVTREQYYAMWLNSENDYIIFLWKDYDERIEYVEKQIADSKAGDTNNGYVD